LPVRNAGRGRIVSCLVHAALTVGVVAFPAPHYELTLRVDYASGGFSGEARIDFTNETAAPLRETFLRLYPNAEAIYGNASLTVRDAFVNGRPVQPVSHLADTAIEIPLGTPLLPGETLQLGLTFEGQAGSIVSPSGGYGLLTKTDHALTLTAFYPLLAPCSEEGWALHPIYPIGDAVTSDVASYRVALTTTARGVPSATGRLVSTACNGDATTFLFEADVARDFAVVFAPDHEQTESRVGGKTIRTSFSPAHSSAGVIALERASAALELFEQQIGPVPHTDIDLVEVPLQGPAGAEFSGLILVSSQYAQWPTDPFFDVIISHEMAHQWFYSAVGNHATEDPWLDEGLATYLSYVFLEHTQSPAAVSELERSERAYRSARQQHPDLTIASSVGAFPDSPTYSAFVYSGGAVFLDAIRCEIGDEAFFRALGDYYRTNLLGLVLPEVFVATFDRACACDLTDLRVEFGLSP
jgi:hypothetical protein